MHTAEEEREQPPKGAVTIARGTTATGASYTIWVQQGQREARQRNCDVDVGFEEFENHGSTGSGFGSDTCLSRSHPEGVRAFCDGTHWEVEGQTLEGATTATVNMSNGAQVNSPIALVPPSLGGPLGFYFQILPASDDPVSLDELDAQGRVLATVPLPHSARCPGSRPRGAAKPPTPPKQVGGGVVVSGHIPHGPRFQILGELDRFMGRIERGASVIVFGEESGAGADLRAEVTLGHGKRPSPFTLKSEPGCRPHEYAVLYGLLEAPGDTVLGEDPRRASGVSRGQDPRRLHMQGVVGLHRARQDAE